MTLRLKGSTSGHTEIKAPAAAGDNTITLPTSNGSAEQFLKNSGTAGELEFSSMVEDSSGNVGIGDSSPGHKLVVTDAGASNTSNYLNVISGNAANAGIAFGDTDTALQAGILYLHSDNALRFFKSGFTEAARIDSSGRLLVGTSSSSADCGGVYEGSSSSAAAIVHLSRSSGVSNGSTLGALDFSDNAQNSYAQIKGAADAAPSGSSYPGRLSFFTTPSGSTSLTERMRIERRGQFIQQSDGTASVDNLFSTVAGAASNALASFRRSATSGSLGTGTEVCRIERDGDLSNTNNSYGALSDFKLKENIVDAASQWNDLKDLRVRKYNFKEETGNRTHTQIGLIAQEVENVSPGLVTESPDFDEEGNDLGTTTKSVNYSVLYMKAVKALQEAQTRIETLETQNTAQQTQIDNLLARVTALEAA